MGSTKRPRLDPQAVARGDVDALVVAVAVLAADLFAAVDSHISFPLSARDVARLGCTPRAGLLAAAIDLRALLAQSPQGRQALRDFGFEPVLEYVEGE